MISDRVITNCMEEVRETAGIDLMIIDRNLCETAAAGSIDMPDRQVLREFLDSDDDKRVIDKRILIKIMDEDEAAYVLISEADDKGSVPANLAAVLLKNLVAAYKDKIDRDSFFQNLLLDNLILVDIYNKARKLHIDSARRRCVYLIEPLDPKENDLTEMVRELFYTEAGDHVTAVDENHIVVIKALVPDDGDEELEETARMLIDMAGSEALSDVRVSYGMVTDDIKGVHNSYMEAKMALEVSKIFYPLKRCINYGDLGVGRLIYQLPADLCRLFIREIFGDDIPDEIDEEVLNTVNKFFDNNLNVSETSRQLYIHRNTLMYRIEKIQKATGLDVRVFDDALTLKIALMVVNYMRYIKADDQSIPLSAT